MKAMLLGAVLATAGVGAAAQVVSGALQASHDSDSFNEQKQTLAYRGAAGWGLSAGALRYTAPAWSENGTTLAATYKQADAARQIDASAGVARIAQHDHATATLNYMQAWLPGTSLGVSAERDFINSERGIQAGLNYNTVMGVLDHAFTDRFNVGAAAGCSFFTNDNQRPILRTRWNYLIDDQVGLNAYLKTRSYRNTRPGQAEYFSPSHLNEASLGLSLRFAMGSVMNVSASVDGGQQRIDGDSQGIWSLAVGLASRRGSPVEWMVGVEATNTASLFTVRADSYRYTSAVARISVPF
ncbi:MAG: hypothetical protein KGL57_11980 [Burkholderiales bacterium]|nr:hypothetical protein [Burkholderiales bacterium]